MVSGDVVAIIIADTEKVTEAVVRGLNRRFPTKHLEAV